MTGRPIPSKVPSPLAAAALPVVGLLGVLCLVGCSAPHLAGTNDAALEYEVEADPGTGTTVEPALAALGMKARLSAAQVPSDVDVTAAGHVRVVVDADVAGGVDDLLAWRGGLRLLRVDDAVALSPPDTTGARPMSARTPAGETRWWQGTGDAISRIVGTTRVPGHVIFSEKADGGEYRTRVAITPAFVSPGVGATPIANIVPLDRERTLGVELPPETRAPIAAERGEHPDEQVVVARGGALLEVIPIAQATETPLVLRFGDDVTSYTRAARAKRLLRSPILPPLRRASAGALPSRYGLAAACALLPFALSFGWLFFVRRFDRARPEPLWLVLATFALGGVSIVPAALLELGASRLSPWLDPTVATLGGQTWALPLAIAVATLVVGGAEEGAKFMGAWSLARHRREFDEPVDGIVYGCASALGFAAVENVKYFAFGRMSGAVIAIRAMETVPAHMFFGAIAGFAMGRTLVSRKARVWPWLLVACLAHGTFDALLSIDGLQLWATLLVLGLAVAFVFMLRSALRHGAVPTAARDAEPDAPPPTEGLPASELPRRYFRVGSPLAFAASAAGMVLCAFAVTVLGTVYEMLHHRVNVVVLVLAAVVLGLLGLSAWAVSATIPLDVAVDARGITFAGGRTAWGALLGVSVEKRGRRAFVRLDRADGPTHIGPADDATASDIVASIRAGRGG